MAQSTRRGGDWWSVREKEEESGEREEKKKERKRERRKNRNVGLAGHRVRLGSHSHILGQVGPRLVNLI